MQDLKELERFIVDNEDLEKIESTFNQFNIFTSLKLVNQEIRHSNFLSWLIDPNESHELGDYFVTQLVKEITLKSKKIDIDSPSIFEVDSWSFDEIEVRREWKNIDILIISEVNKYFVVIENKIRSGENGNQLSKYFSAIKREYPNFKGSFVFLTVDGISASMKEYVSIDYELISNLISKLLISKSGKVSIQIETFIEHYNQMLKKYIMTDSELQKICRQIYKKHKRALDLIFEYRPDRLMEIKEILVECIQSNDKFILDDSNKPYVRFLPIEMDFIPKKGTGWTSSKRVLLFEFRNFKAGLKLCLLIGPGDSEIRNTLYELAAKNQNLFNKSQRSLTDQWFSIYIKKDILKRKEIDELGYEEVKELITKRFNKFINNDLPKLEFEINKLKKDYI